MKPKTIVSIIVVLISIGIAIAGALYIEEEYDKFEQEDEIDQELEAEPSGQ